MSLGITMPVFMANGKRQQPNPGKISLELDMDRLILPGLGYCHFPDSTALFLKFFAQYCSVHLGETFFFSFHNSVKTTNIKKVNCLLKEEIFLLAGALLVHDGFQYFIKTILS